MENDGRITCVVFGSIPSSAECVRYLLENPAYRLLGVVTDPDYRCSWAANEQHVIDVAVEYAIPLLEMDEIIELKPQWGFSLRFNRIIKPDVINSFSKGILNFHGGILPYNKGACCLNWALLYGQPEFGITVHYIDPGIDTGDIVEVLSWKVEEDDTAWTLFKKQLELMPGLFLKIIKKIEKGEVLTGVPQDQLREHDWPMWTKKKSDLEKCKKIDLSVLKANPQEALRTIRAFDFPGREPAYTIIDDKKVYLRISTSE